MRPACLLLWLGSEVSCERMWLRAFTFAGARREFRREGFKKGVLCVPPFATREFGRDYSYLLFPTINRRAQARRGRFQGTAKAESETDALGGRHFSAQVPRRGLAMGQHAGRIAWT